MPSCFSSGPRRLVVPVLFALSATISVVGEDPNIRSGERTLRIPRVTRPPKLIDFLYGNAREAELTVKDFKQFMPGDGTPASQETAAYLSYDDKNLYVAFVCRDDPKQIRARVAKRELIMMDDRFNVCLDTFHDHRHMYWFDINPYGIQADGNVTDGVEDDPSWDTLWHTEAKITEDGYVGMAVIPFKSIRFPSSGEQTWGLILGRWIMRNNEYSMWPYVSRQRPGFVQQGGDMEGLHDISPGRNVQLIPYGLFSRSRFLESAPGANAAMQTKTEGRAGLDAKVVVKDAFTLDATINPDFSQVESDEPQVTVNQRFEVFFPEKRPFFMENAGYFKTPQQLFFSRRIADPRMGARLTGRVGKWALGALMADDRAPGERVGKDDELSGRQAGIGVFRLQRDFLHNSNAAIMATGEDFGSTHNRVYSFDTRLQLLPNWSLIGQAMTSDTRLRGGARITGPAYFAEWLHAGKHFISDTTYTDRSPNFRADLGFVNRVDMREAAHTMGYKWRPEGSWLVSFGPVLKGSVNYDRQGRLQDWSINPEFEIELPRMTEIALERREAYELFDGIGFRHYHNEIEFSSEWQRWLALNASASAGRSINYYPGSGLVPFLGAMRDLSAGFTLRPTPRLRLDESYLFSSLKAGSFSSLNDSNVGASVFNNHIVRSKMNYQFNREISMRVILDYNSVLPNADLISLEKTKHIGVDALFTYMLNPGTAIHIGYTDLYDNLRLDPSLSPALRRTAAAELNTGRQIFVKLSYLLRF